MVNGLDLGPPGALAQQARLNDMLIPQRGVFAVARAFLQMARPLSSMRPMRDKLNVEDIKELS